MANGINNKYEYRSGLLDSLQVQHTASDVRNEDEYRKKVLNGLGVEYTEDDINQKNLYRAKVVEGLASSGGGSGGGGGESDFSTAQVTLVNNSGATVDIGYMVSPLFQIYTDFTIVNLGTEIANNETLVLDLLTPIDLGETPIASVMTGVVSNMVNCSVNDGNLFITNPAQNSSCIITIS